MSSLTIPRYCHEFGQPIEGKVNGETIKGYKCKKCGAVMLDKYDDYFNMECSAKWDTLQSFREKVKNS